MRDIRGGRISIIFQEPMTALSPLHTIGNQIGEALALHREVSQRERREAVIEMLRRVGFPDPVEGRAHLSVRALGRPAPARDDRHGAGLPPGAADRRRADHRARRHHPGADPPADPGPADRIRHGGAAHHARSRRRRQHGRRGGGDVSRPGDGSRKPCDDIFRDAQPSVPEGADARGAALQHGPGRAPDADPRGAGRRRITCSPPAMRPRIDPPSRCSRSSNSARAMRRASARFSDAARTASISRWTT